MVRIESVAVEWGIEKRANKLCPAILGDGKEKKRVYPDSSYMQAFKGKSSGANTLVARL